ncbi:MAG: ROK family protein [Candidatus Omnitrophica bacterium]|nr:ROK family protein [Candidatus Omnitrophota bacterium]
MRPQFIVGIVLGGTNLKIALADLRYHIKDTRLLTTGKFLTKESLIQAIISATESILKKNRIEKNRVLGVGLGLPGPIDSKRGLVHFFPNIPGWKEVKLKKILEQRLKLPVFIDNDANLMALAEQRLGAAKGVKNAVCITLGTGVGGGLILEGELYRGSNFAAGEIGHMPVNEKGPKCNCGGTACLEAYIGNNRILELAGKLFGKNISLEELSLLAAKRNRRAQELWYNVANYLGIVLSGVVNLIDPDVIVIGGGVANAGKILFDNVKGAITKRAMAVQAKHVKVRKAALGNRAGMIGAVILVKESLEK